MVIPVDVELVAQDAGKAVERGDVVIVIDALRATTSIITLLANGVKSVIPVETLREAMKLHRRHSDYVLVGERADYKPKGFDFGNSPVTLAKEPFQGKHIILTTTNGTKALIKSKGSRWVTVGAFLNARAVAEKTVEISRKNRLGISFVLAGEKNHFSLEDFLCAGAITDSFPKNALELSDKTVAALLAFKGAKQNLLESIHDSKHAQDLVKIGFSKDIEFSCRLNICDTVPFYRNGKLEVIA
jgi:2-phosphosulfolactate phosphatase